MLYILPHELIFTFWGWIKTVIILLFIGYVVGYVSGSIDVIGAIVKAFIG